MAWIAGVDGCPDGWLVVYEETEAGDLDCRIETSFEGVMAYHAPLVAVAVDMPIGLSNKGKRDCDDKAREALRPWRHRSIFPAPAADVLDLFPKMTSASFRNMTLPERERDYNRAKTVNRDRTGKALNRQSFNLVPKIAEVRGYLLGLGTAERGRVHEVHPEVSFAALSAQKGGGHPFSPMHHRKVTVQGLLERRDLLASEFGKTLDALEAKARCCKGDAAPDDFYDAVACLWTARGIYKETCGYLPKDGGPCDAKGLPMRIVY